MIFHALEERPQGLMMGELYAAISGVSHERARARVEKEISEGRLEHWPFAPEFVRATQLAPSPFLREVALLRMAASEPLAAVSAASGWPATVHLLRPGSHAVLERYPWVGDDEALTRERQIYRNPRSLKSGATAMAILSCVPKFARAAFLARVGVMESEHFFSIIRKQGYCLMEGREVKGGWILSAPICAADGTPYGALCTYGFAEVLPPHIVESATSVIVASAAKVSASMGDNELSRRARAIIRNFQKLGDGCE